MAKTPDPKNFLAIFSKNDNFGQFRGLCPIADANNFAPVSDEDV